MKNPVISIIIPVYNGECFIHNAIQNILDQTYDNFEIILVNDGSLDRSLEICESEKVRNPDLITVVNKANGGIASARNAGIERATGEYITFMDQDDSLAQNAFLEVVQAFQEFHTDIVIFEYQKKFSSIIKPGYSRFPTKKVVSREVAKKDFFSDIFFGFVWGATFSSKILYDNNIRFNENYHVIDDIDFFYSALSAANKILYLPLVLYTWVQRNESESHRNVLQPACDIIFLTQKVDKSERYGLGDTYNMACGYCLEQLLVYCKALEVQKFHGPLLNLLYTEANKYVVKVSIFDLKVLPYKKIKFLLFRFHLLKYIYRIKAVLIKS